MNPDLNAEHYVIGACLLSADAVRFAEQILHHSDFYRPQLGEAFRIMSAMRTAGEPIEPYTVATKLKEHQVGGLEYVHLFSFMEATSSAHTVEFYAKQVREDAVKRALRAAGQKLMQQSGQEGLPPAQVLSEALEGLRAIRENTPGKSLTSKKLAEILAVVEDHDWVVPGLFERGDRMIITGYEGLGKSTWIRQMAILFAAGINPITLDHIEPVRVQVVDVENTEGQWRKEVRGIVAKAAQYGKHDPGNIDIACHGRIDITKDTGLSAIHRLVDQNRPDILFIGPIYKMVANGINNDDDAAPLITALDSLRDRGLVLVMEGHSPKGNGQQVRDLSPRGSAALMGWPEFGFGLAPEGDGSSAATIQRWRGDRTRGTDWPKRLEKGGPFPWTADNVHPETRRKFYGWEKSQGGGF
ncbi:AAA family ATPase [Arthrobacter sp. 92]|uniref:AAA family ATPase n=1 Tax=Arthrobacter sp. 92 TaxID=3418175 RepID=UPI003D08D01D